MSVKITKIEVQKKSKNRYSLFDGEKFITGISQDTLIRFNLHSGKILSEQDIHEIESAELLFKMRDQALRYLSRRAHSRKELFDKLRNKGHRTDLIDHILDELRDRGYIDDKAFARMFTDEEIRLKSSGPLLIRSKLMQRGIHAEIIEQTVFDLYSMEDQLTNCRKLAEKKYRTDLSAIDEKQRTGLISYLKTKGFHWEHISAAIPEILKGNQYE